MSVECKKCYREAATGPDLMKAHNNEVRNGGPDV